MADEYRKTLRFSSVPAYRALAAFEVGKEYVYEYRGKLIVKNPEQPLQSAGLAFKSKVVTQPRKEHTHFKVRKVLASIRALVGRVKKRKGY